MVRVRGLEPPMLMAPGPKPGGYTNSPILGYTAYLCPDGAVNHPQLYIA